MNANALSENGWKALIGKQRIKDNGLQRALADYQKSDDDDHAGKLKGIAKINQLAAALQNNKEVAGNDAVVDYLDDVQDAANAEQREIAKAKMTADKAEAEAEKQEKAEGAYEAKLMATLNKLKSSNGASYEFMFCDGQDQCAVIVEPTISAQHKQQLMQVTGGGKRFSKLGSCRFEEGKFVFAMEHPPSGLARKLQGAIANFTGRKLPIMVGPEAAEADADV